MKLQDLRPAPGAKKEKKVIGRGGAHGRSSTRGTKGQKARSGGAKPSWFEGGQTPLIRRIPKRGFSNIRFANFYNVVSLSTLNKKFTEGTKITPDLLLESRIIKKKNLPLKVLDGILDKKLIIHAHKFSKSASEKIKSVGGEAIVII